MGNRGMQKKLSDWMSKAKPKQPTRCSVCRNAKLAEAIAQFRRAKIENRTTISWAQFRRDFLLPNDLVVTYHVLQHHLRTCMGTG